jgi:cytochrome P450
MLLHPHVMRRAHAELDAVVGRDRFPSFKDKDSLPYLQAILKETLRWRPAAPLSMGMAKVVMLCAEYMFSCSIPPA